MKIEQQQQQKKGAKFDFDSTYLKGHNKNETAKKKQKLKLEKNG